MSFGHWWDRDGDAFRDVDVSVRIQNPDAAIFPRQSCRGGMTTLRAGSNRSKSAITCFGGRLVSVRELDVARLDLGSEIRLVQVEARPGRAVHAQRQIGRAEMLGGLGQKLRHAATDVEAHGGIAEGEGDDLVDTSRPYAGRCGPGISRRKSAGRPAMIEEGGGISRGTASLPSRRGPR